MAVSNLDVYRVADLMLRQHGAEARSFAAERADAMLARSDLEGRRLWRRVEAAVDVLQRAVPSYWCRNGCVPESPGTVAIVQ